MDSLDPAHYIVYIYIFFSIILTVHVSGGWSSCIPEQKTRYSPKYKPHIGCPNGVLLGRVRMTDF